MALKPKPRGWLLVCALGLTLAAVYSAPPPEAEALETVPPTPRTHFETTNPVVDSDSIPDIVVTRDSDGTPLENPFANQAIEFAPVASITQDTAQPPAPSAPPMPYAYLGKLQEDGETVVFLGKQGNNYSVRVGDTLDQLYRIEAINEQAVTLVYLPLDAKQTLPIGRNTN